MTTRRFLRRFATGMACALCGAIGSGCVMMSREEARDVSNFYHQERDALRDLDIDWSVMDTEDEERGLAWIDGAKAQLDFPSVVALKLGHSELVEYEYSATDDLVGDIIGNAIDSGFDSLFGTSGSDDDNSYSYVYEDDEPDTYFRRHSIDAWLKEAREPQLQQLFEKDDEAPFGDTVYRVKPDGSVVFSGGGAEPEERDLYISGQWRLSPTPVYWLCRKSGDRYLVLYLDGRPFLAQWEGPKETLAANRKKLAPSRGARIGFRGAN